MREDITTPNGIESLKIHRHEKNPLEKLYHDMFIKEQLEPDTDVHFIAFPMDSEMGCSGRLSNREKSIMLSTIQWLGSPVGKNFVERVQETFKNTNK